jgi:hypothetical protein
MAIREDRWTAKVVTRESGSNSGSDNSAEIEDKGIEFIDKR